MNISEVFKLANGIVNDDMLIPIINFENEDFKSNIEKSWNTKFPKYEDIKKGIEYLGLDIKYFYASSNYLRPFYYKNEWVLVDINTFEIEYLEMFEVKKRIEIQESSFKKKLEDKDFESLFYVIINEAVRFDAFQSLFDLIPDNQKYDIFINIYTANAYGFKELDKDFVKKVFTYRTEEVQNKIGMKLLSNTDNEGFVRIYRGTEGESTPSTEAFSWTTNYNVALRFAAWYGIEGSVHTGKVHINNVIDFLQDRNEFEVIVDPKNIVDFQEMNNKDFNDIVNQMSETGYLELYHNTREKIKPELFMSPNGIHGVLHCKRVLMLTLMLSMLESLNDDDRNILIKSAQYHDIGRINDDEDYEHGKLSIKKMKELKLFRNNKTQKDEILRFIIENHCIPDDIALENIDQYKISDKEHAIYLFKLFKDADGLDRVRLGDLDLKYLRNENAKKLGRVAFLLNRNLK